MEFIAGFFSRNKTKSPQISEDDAYLMIVIIGLDKVFKNNNDSEKNNDSKINLEDHRKVICEIYDKRYKAYWENWFKNVTFWSVIILLFPFVLNKLPTVIYHILKIFNFL